MMRLPSFRLPDADTRFTLPIVDPKTGEEVSAETLYNRCCDAMGHVVQDHIGDLILDNLKYPENHENDAPELCGAVYAWAASVYAQLPKPEPFATWAFIDLDDDGERVCIIEYDNPDCSYPFSQELIVRLPACYGGVL